jgi:hypothetical protein
MPISIHYSCPYVHLSYSPSLAHGARHEVCVARRSLGVSRDSSRESLRVGGVLRSHRQCTRWAYVGPRGRPLLAAPRVPPLEALRGGLRGRRWPGSSSSAGSMAATLPKPRLRVPLSVSSEDMRVSTRASTTRPTPSDDEATNTSLVWSIDEDLCLTGGRGRTCENGC